MAKMTPRMKDFVMYYCLDPNATQAAIKAGYSTKTARQAGAENLSKPVIQEAIAKERAKTAEKVSITKEEMVRDLLKLKKVGEEIALSGLKPSDRVSGVYSATRVAGKISEILGFDAPEKLQILDETEELSDEELDKRIKEEEAKNRYKQFSNDRKRKDTKTG